jgi:hypothetical protein
MKRLDIWANVEIYRRCGGPDSRDASWDYCFGFFQAAHETGACENPTDQFTEMACLHIASYLASWGMYRGS